MDFYAVDAGRVKVKKLIEVASKSKEWLKSFLR
jgi:hypothetical protein